MYQDTPNVRMHRSILDPQDYDDGVSTRAAREDFEQTQDLRKRLVFDMNADDARIVDEYEDESHRGTAQI